MTVPIPDETAQRKRIVLVVVASLVALAVVAGGAWALLRPGGSDDAPVAFTPAQETTASGPTTSSAVASALAGEGTSASAPGVGGPGTPATPRSAKVAFHLGRTLYVANEDGSGTTPLKVTESEYALSPDGTSVAVVRRGKLEIIPVAGGETAVAGTAEIATPVWLPDSSAVLFVRADSDGVPSVWRVKRDGSGAKVVATGQGMAVSPDGKTVAMLSTEADADATQVTVITNGGAPRKVAVSGGEPVAVALSNTQLYVSTLSAEGATAIWVSGLDGRGKRALVSGLPAEGKTVTFGRMMPSLDGRSLAYTADGDDGYSRIWVVPVAGGSPRQVTSRRDGYPLGWTADGKRILFFEGNGFQGESSALWVANPDGSERRMVVSGAVQ